MEMVVEAMGRRESLEAGAVVMMKDHFISGFPEMGSSGEPPCV